MLLPKILTASACVGLLALALTGGQGTLKAQTLSPTQSTATSYSGQATVINVTDIHEPVPGPIIICDTGPLPSSGGFLEASVMETNFMDDLTLELARATTSGDGPLAQSMASVNNLFIAIKATDGTISTLRADYIAASAEASCAPNGKINLNGSFQIEGLVLNGEAIKLTRKANQVFLFPGGKITVNQQTSAVNGNEGDITVIALHIEVEGCMNGIICSAHADITCGAVPPPPTDCGKLTGGGWIVGTPSGAKGTFGVSGGIRRGQFWGHLNYIDHGTGMHVRSTAVTGFTVDPNDTTCRIITYNVLIDDSPGTATVRACDKGEPGRDDIFDITLSNGYHAGGDLGGEQPGGGNIQLHKCPPGWQ